MESSDLDLHELAERRNLLEQRIKGYQENLSVLAGPCSRSSLSRKIEECEMELEQVRSQLGEI